jgi:hypothetical protein
MGFEFAETMSGTLELDKEPGKKHPIEFQLRAYAASTREHIKDGRASVNGVVKAPPLTESADLDGTLLIRPLGQRVIRYELSFVGDDGQRY